MVLPKLRLFEGPSSCSLILTDFFLEVDTYALIQREDPRLKAIEDTKTRLYADLLATLNTNISQKIETLMYKKVDELHNEYEAEQRRLNEEKSKVKRPEPKQLFDFEEQFRNNSAMGTKSVFGSNRLVSPPISYIN
jgi:hypothetical protein